MVCSQFIMFFASIPGGVSEAGGITVCLRPFSLEHSVLDFRILVK